MNYYIIILEEKIKSFSLIGYGERCAVSMMLKGNRDPLAGIAQGDKAVGYIAGSVRAFSYLFQVGYDQDTGQPYFEKTLESKEGARIESLPPEIRELVASMEQTEGFLNINEAQYRQITAGMWKVLEASGLLPMGQGSESVPPAGSVSDDAAQAGQGLIDESARLKGGSNVLLYGVPGCGKSHIVKNRYCRDAEGVERVVFHPDFTYGDFAGQILPVTGKDGSIKYEFSPGPFTRVLRQAYSNPAGKYCLVIEEINRGNAPAVFGDIFQLLDRDGDGNSTYEITNEDIAQKVYGSGGRTKVSIPSNLSIIATMNTSDQNVFTLDTAFQRRWNMRMVENDVSKAVIAKKKILDSGITWERFNQTVNRLILSKNVGIASSEDKRLGAYFVTEGDLWLYSVQDGITQEEAEERNRSFPEKVLKYLWDDAFKFTRDEVFKEEYDSLEKLIKAFGTAEGDDRFAIFRDDIFK